MIAGGEAACEFCGPPGFLRHLSALDSRSIYGCPWALGAAQRIASAHVHWAAKTVAGTAYVLDQVA